MAGPMKIAGALAVAILWACAPALSSPKAATQAEAERLLERIIAEQRAQQARDRAEADQLLSSALEAFKKGNYAAARTALKRALRLDPANAAARKLLTSVEAKLRPSGNAASPSRARPQQIEQQLQVALLEGRRLLNEGQTLAAIEVLENVEHAIASAAPTVNLNPYRAEANAILAQARAALKAQKERQSFDPTTPSVFNPQGTRGPGELGPVPRPTASESERRSLERDQARFWAKPSTFNEEFDFAAAELAVQPIGPPPIIRYPADWKEKSARRLAQARAWPEWYRKLKRKLDEPLDIDFKGVPLTQALTFLRDLSGVNIAIDPALRTAGLDRKRINLQVSRIKLASALNLIADITGTAYVLRDEVVWFTTPQRAREHKVVKVYNIADLTTPLRNNLEWHPLRPPESWEADPWWERYLDWWERWGYGWGSGGTAEPGRPSHYPPFWPSPNKDGDSRERRARYTSEMIERLIEGTEK